jgi:hypothetical protein
MRETPTLRGVLTIKSFPQPFGGSEGRTDPLTIRSVETFSIRAVTPEPAWVHFPKLNADVVPRSEVPKECWERLIRSNTKKGQQTPRLEKEAEVFADPSPIDNSVEHQHFRFYVAFQRSVNLLLVRVFERRINNFCHNPLVWRLIRQISGGASANNLQCIVLSIFFPLWFASLILHF